jgi:hypothetical protein
MAAMNRRASLVYEDLSKEQQALNAEQETEVILQQLCRDTATDIRPETSKVFSDLVSAIRKLDTQGVRKISFKLGSICPSNARVA